jgi:hypothetical protein
VNTPLTTEQRGSESVFPLPARTISRGNFAHIATDPTDGLTKRELLAAMAMQAILTGAVTRGCPAHEWTDQSMAVKCADALLAALDQSHG